MTGQPNPVEPPDVDPEPRVFDRITDAVFALDEEFQFTYLNTRAEKLLEANAEDLLGERIWEAHPGSKETELYDAFHDALETQQSTERELYYDPLDVWVEMRVYPSETGISVYFRDITEQREHRRELDFREALLEAQAETTLDGQLVVDQDRTILYYNQQFADMWDIPETILTERSEERVLEYVLDMLADPAEFREKIEYLYDNPEAESRDEIHLADGRWLDRYSAPVIGEDGTHYGRLWVYRDITERKERERQLSTLMDNIPGMVYRCRNEPGWPMEFVSEGCQELTGYDPEALESDDLSYGADIVFEEDREALWEGVQRGLEDEGSFLVTYRIKTATEDVRWVRERGHGIYDESGNLEVLEGVIIDVTERKRLETELDEILGRVTDAFYALDEEFRFTHVNEQAEALLQASEDDLLGETLWEMFPEAAEITEVWDAFQTALDTQEPQSFELHYDPLEFWVEARLYPSDTGVSVYFRDITDRKEYEQKLEESERRYRTLVENFPDGAVGLFDQNMQYTAIGGELLTEVGVDPDERIGRNVSELYPDELAAETEPNFQAALEGEVNSFEIEFHDRYLHAHTLPVKNADDEIFAGMLVVQDVTERREYQHRLEESNERLEQFAYAVSHDLQEPLRMVTSYLQLLEQRYADDLDEDAEEFIDFAVDGAERMRDMIDGLLEYSRVTTTGDPLKPVELERVVDEVLEDLQFRIEQTDADITIESLPCVEGDENQLRQVFQNLIDNAIEYSGDEPPRIHIAADRDSEEWLLSVRDDGVGIEPDDQERIFGIFQRLHTHDERAGTGIGLALCKQIVKRHGGEIWVESEPGEGSTFSFTLPTAGDIDT